jgi:hypothetical protein
VGLGRQEVDAHERVAGDDLDLRCCAVLGEDHAAILAARRRRALAGRAS